MSDVSSVEAVMRRAIECCILGSTFPATSSTVRARTAVGRVSAGGTPDDRAGTDTDGAFFESEASSNATAPCGVPVQEWNGLDTLDIPECQHGMMAVMKRCWGGSDSGRRFLGCPLENGRCGYVRWLDEPWPVRAQAALTALWVEVKTNQRRIDLANQALSAAVRHQGNAVRKIRSLRRMQLALNAWRNAFVLCTTVGP